MPSSGQDNNLTVGGNNNTSSNNVPIMGGSSGEDSSLAKDDGVKMEHFIHKSSFIYFFICKSSSICMSTFFYMRVCFF